jgi:transposase InsO family protein
VTLALIDAAVESGACLERACERLGVSARTIQRWRKSATAEDRRQGPKSSPANRLSASERRRLLTIANSEEFRDLSPKQIVPRLADQGRYVASESSFYRVLRAEKQLAHRGRAKAPNPRSPPQLRATGPNQLWSWDITYLKSSVRGAFYYLYMVVDVYSRRVVAAEVHAEESSALAASMMQKAVAAAGHPVGLRTHSDNGAPMKGSTLLATLQALGIVPSFSRPSVSDDNPFSESLFRTLKYRPTFPEGAFDSLHAARSWVERFVRWYNTEHRHSGIRFVTPDERHFGLEQALLARRDELYEQARRRRPERWSGATRNWTPAGPVRLSPDRREGEQLAAA